MARIEFGWALPTFAGSRDTHIDDPCYEEVDWDLTRDTVLLCEELGFDSAWVADHLILGREGEILEVWTVMTALAAITKRLRIGSLVLCEAHRNPALAAKMAATFDVISKGRLDYGIGAGWHKVEMQAYGLPWNEKPAVRVRRMIESIKIAKLMWTEKKASFKGRYYEVKDAVCDPKPVQRPHPPVWVGAWGEKLMLRAVARYADGWNSGGPVDLFKHKLDVLTQHCRDVGRDPKSVKVSWDGHILVAPTGDALRRQIERIKLLSPRYPLETEIAERPMPEMQAKYDFLKSNLVGTPDHVIKRIQEYADIGVTHFMLWFLDFPSRKGIELFAKEVMPSFK
ncbi:MAG: LLM class flavin-dependent oxidoreductase [Candidatus Bathyarchaeia archaeon]